MFPTTTAPSSRRPTDAMVERTLGSWSDESFQNVNRTRWPHDPSRRRNDAATYLAETAHQAEYSPWPPTYVERSVDQRAPHLMSGTRDIDAAVGQTLARSIREGITTLMLIDLPCTLSLADIRNEMACLGFADSYDFIFYPREKKNYFRGFCFVNFVSTSETRRFASVFVDYKFELSPSRKRSNAQLARTQGLVANVLSIKRGAAKEDDFFIDGKRLQHLRGGW
eukprot:TRINITY_DN18793_c0_g1_i1.p1 TRINITY_DN18793_c0_g1~~TRINITY_DN18793_c0_g1_i1.p1  ORF type:complete len:224 (+),score=12.04 TRINITY_DN18793_c0_g1_i1:22-693(+)